MRVTTLIIGAGHAGLAMSHCLGERAIDHCVLERGEVANSWKTERWDSLRLLTPNWQSRLPGYRYQGADPDGFRTMPETIDYIEGYARSFAAPVQTHTTVSSIREHEGGYRVTTDRGVWDCRTVVLATGACNIPTLPGVAAALPQRIASVTPNRYRNPDQIAPGGVLVVGASSTGTQIAEELRRAGRAVTLAVGEHIRAPRTYRGRDIEWWMDAAGVMDDHYTDQDDIARARNVPSLQLAGSPDRRTVDLNRLSGLGVRLVGRLAGVAGNKLQFSGSLANQCAMADLKMNRLLDRMDAWATEAGIDGDVDPAHRFAPTHVDPSPPLGVELDTIDTVVWATGYRPDYSWLHVPVLDRKGRIRHDGGVAEAPGLYVMGLPFLRRRKSSLLDGAGADATDLGDHLVGYLGGANGHRGTGWSARRSA